MQFMYSMVLVHICIFLMSFYRIYFFNVCCCWNNAISPLQDKTKFYSILLIKPSYCYLNIPIWHNTMHSLKMWCCKIIGYNWWVLLEFFPKWTKQRTFLRLSEEWKRLQICKHTGFYHPQYTHGGNTWGLTQSCKDKLKWTLLELQMGKNIIFVVRLLNLKSRLSFELNKHKNNGKERISLAFSPPNAWGGGKGKHRLTT